MGFVLRAVLVVEFLWTTGVLAFVPVHLVRAPPLAARFAEAPTADYEVKIAEANDILYRAADTKAEDPDLVFDALSDLEKLMR